MKIFGRLVCLCVLTLLLQGCETWRGARDGFSEDWRRWTERDKQVQEKYW